MFESTTPKKKGPKHLNRLHVAENLISAYLNLSENNREYVEGFLALQVYGDAGMGDYTPGRPVAIVIYGNTLVLRKSSVKPPCRTEFYAAVQPQPSVPQFLL